MPRDYTCTGRDRPDDRRLPFAKYTPSIAAALLLLTGCKGPDQVQLRGMAMTIPYHIVVESGHDEGMRKIITETFAEVDARVNDWNPQSEVSRINALPKGERLTISAELADFLQAVGDVVEKTEGFFDPTIGPAVRVWRERLAQGEIPTAEELEAVRARVGFAKLHLEGTTVWKEAEVELDLGGIAKGYAVDLIAERLKEAGVQNFLVSWGGEVYGAGRHPSGRAWQVVTPDGVQALEDQALATSGDTEQSWETPTGTYTHICHPKTLQAVQIERVGKSVSVTAPTCLEADGLATARYLSG